MKIKEEQKKFNILGVEITIPNDANYIAVDYDGTVKAYCDSHPWTEPNMWEGEHEAELCVIENENGEPFNNWQDLIFSAKTNPS